MYTEFESLTTRAARRPLGSDELKLCTAIACALLMYGSAQRPSALMGCSLQEFRQRKKRGDVEVICVKDHKTSSGGPARLTMDSRATRVLKAYVDIIRPHIGEGEKLLLLPTAGSGAEPVSRTDTLMSVLESQYGIEIPTPTAFRKAIATSVPKSGTYEDVRLIAFQMTHNVETHKKHYMSLKTTQGAAQAHKIISNVTKGAKGGKGKKKRRRYTTEEMVEIESLFRENMASCKSISIEEGRQFVRDHPHIQRTGKRIQDRVATAIKNVKDAMANTQD